MSSNLSYTGIVTSKDTRMLSRAVGSQGLYHRYTSLNYLYTYALKNPISLLNLRISIEHNGPQRDHSLEHNAIAIC